MDEVSRDMPHGCWSVQAIGNVALIRNNVWRGYTAFSKANSTSHGAVYVGNGMKNTAFCFM